MKKIFYFILLLVLLIVFPACQETPKESTVTLSYDMTEIETYVGEVINVKPTVSGNEANEEYVITYQLSDAIAEIDEEGNLTAIEEGIVDVVATININPNTFAQLTIVISKLGNGVYKLTLDVNGGQPLEKDSIIFKKGEKVELPTPVKDGCTFLGWYNEDDELVSEIKNKNYNLVAKWESLDSIIKVSYDLSEGVYLSNYKTRKEMVDDFISDLQDVKNDTFTYEYLQEHTGTGYGIFVSAKGAKTFFANEELRVKWGWVLEYLKAKRIEAGLDVTYYDAVMQEGYASTGAATVNLEVIAFICEKDCDYVGEDVSYETVDYSIQENGNGFWQAMNDYYKKNNTYKKEMTALNVIPGAIKVGAEFEGWYTSSDLSDSSKVTNSYKFYSSVTLYPKFKNPNGTINVSFDYKGGINEALYFEYGTKLSTIVLSGYNGDFWEGINYQSNIYISDKTKDPTAQFSTRIYVALDEYTEIYKVIAIQRSGEKSVWPKKAEYVITISGQYNGTYDDKFDLSKVSVGHVVLFDKDVKTITSSNLGNMYICDNELTKYELKEIVNDSFVVPTPIRTGYSFEGWYDDFSNKYDEASDFEGMTNIKLYAIWKFKGQIIGEFEDKSWAVKGNNIQLLTTFIGESHGNLIWKSENEEIATVSQTGLVTGVSEGLATIIVCDPIYPDINFTYYVTILNETPTGLLKLIVDSNNASIYRRDGLIIGIITEPGYYYASVTGSVSKLLFEDYVVHSDYYLSNPNNKSTLTGENKTGIDFVTFHYAADMNANPSNGGKNLASWNKGNNTNGTQASWHYGTGNDGVWYCQNEAYGAWHAGSSKAMKWYDTGIKYQDGDPEFPKITLGSDNYFYLNGAKTKVANTTQGTRLNNMGLAHKIENGNYYITGHYYNTSYRYISSVGGNNNSIGIESSCGKGSDLWLTWQYSAQLCADLLLRHNLPLTRLVGHHFFSGKWCPQPMLEYDMEIWWEFVELVRQEMVLLGQYKDAEISFASNSEYLKDNGRVSYLPNTSECVTYTVTYTEGTETKTITLSSVLPAMPQE